MPELEPRREVHAARKEYPCDAPFRPCSRRIRRGDPYTQLSYPPNAAPYFVGLWTIVRACSVCAPIPHEVASRAPAPCTFGSSDTQCELPAHGPDRPHQFPIGLF